MAKHYETNEDGVLTKAGRTARNADRAAKKSAAKNSYAVQNAPAAGQKAGEGAWNYADQQKQANDAERDAGGTKNKEGLLTGTGSQVVNEALKKASVGADD